MNRPFGLPNGAPFKELEAKLADGFLPFGSIHGLILSNDTATDPTNDIGISEGVARSTVNIVDGAASTRARDQIDLELPVAIIKQLDVAFAPENYDPDGYASGGRSGGRSSSAITDTSWHAILAGGNGLQADVFFHDSLTQTNVLAEMQKIGGYSAYRRLGSFVRSTSIKLFTQVGDYFRFKTPTVDLTTTTLGTTSTNFTLASVPTGVRFEVLFNLVADHASINAKIYLRNPDDTDTASSESSAPLATINIPAAPSETTVQGRAWTNLLAQVAAVSSTSNTTLRGAPLGYWDLRGRDG